MLTGIKGTIDDKSHNDLISISNTNDNHVNSNSALKGVLYNTMIADIDNENRFSWVDEGNPERLYSINLEDNTLTITEEGTTVTIPDFNNGDMGIYLNGLDHLQNKELEMLKRQELEDGSRNRALEAHTLHQSLMQEINAHEQNPEHPKTPLTEAKVFEDPEQQPVQQAIPQHDLTDIDARQVDDAQQIQEAQKTQATQYTQDLPPQEIASPQASYAYSAYNSALDERIPEPTNEIATHRVDRDEEIKMFGGYKLGDQHPEIQEIQEMLNHNTTQKSFHLPEDGRFSRETESRLQTVQMRCGLEPTGIADALTIERLKETLLDRETQLALKAERAADRPSITLYERNNIKVDYQPKRNHLVVNGTPHNISSFENSALSAGIVLYQADAVIFGKPNPGVDDQFDLTFYEPGSKIPGVRVASINGLSKHKDIEVSERISEQALGLSREREMGREHDQDLTQDGPGQSPERS